MKKWLFTIIVVWTGIIAGIVLAAPPAGIIGTSVRSLFTDATGNVGVRTISPATLLDINGTTTIRASLDMTGNRILNVATPTAGTDAVNKTYTDAVIGSMGPAIKLWGEGRPGTSVINTLGECTSTLAGPVIKVSRSTRLATWDGARAVCPANWWVCSAAERGTRVCGRALKNTLLCNVPSITDDLQLGTNASAGWVSNSGTVVGGGTAPGGTAAQTISGGGLTGQYTCNIIPVWCCSY